VDAGENVLAVALAAGIPLPHSCRQGRCASCRARLLSGEIAYPDGRLPPGLSAGEAAAGAVLLCQASPRSALHIETRLVRASAAHKTTGVILAIEPLAFDTLRLRLRLAGTLAARPGQFVDVHNTAGASSRLPLIATRDGEIELEAASDGSAFREWLGGESRVGASLLLKGPFDAPR
jgi:CDP-4-dehydro-6-deoxyglucose reductase, E3